MQDTDLKSAAFRRGREGTWRTLDQMVNRVEKKGLSTLTSGELMRFPLLYRATVSSLSVAREISLDRSLLDYLEALSTRAFFCIYGSHGGFFRFLARFFLHDFPGAVRGARFYVITAAVALVIGMSTGYFLTHANVEWFHTFISDAMAGGRTPSHTAEQLREPLISAPEEDGVLQIFAAWLFSHNATVGILCFALGFALGIPVFLILFQNGTMIGAMVALYDRQGLGVDFGGWLLIHGTTELMALLLAAAAGLMLGNAVAFPGRMRRRDSLAQQGRKAGVICMGAVVMFMISGVLEGFGRTLIVDTEVRYLVAAAMGVFWLVYFTLCGRER